MRLGFFLGFLIGAGIASFISLAQRAEAPDEDSALSGPAETSRALLDKLKHQARQAKDEGREAKLAKEAELLRAYEETLRQNQDRK